MSKDQTPTQTPTIEAYNVDGFCRAHHISRAFFYQILKKGQGPRLLRVGRRTLISKKAAADWRARLESESVA